MWVRMKSGWDKVGDKIIYGVNKLFYMVFKKKLIVVLGL